MFHCVYQNEKFLRISNVGLECWGWGLPRYLLLCCYFLYSISIHGINVMTKEDLIKFLWRIIYNSFRFHLMLHFYLYSIHFLNQFKWSHEWKMNINNWITFLRSLFSIYWSLWFFGIVCMDRIYQPVLQGDNVAKFYCFYNTNMYLNNKLIMTCQIQHWYFILFLLGLASLFVY